MRTGPSRRSRWAGAAALAALVLAAGCGNRSTPPSTELDVGNPNDPGAVCRQFAVALHTVDTARDPSRGAAAAHRIRPYVTPQLADEAAAAWDSETSLNDSQWKLWTQHQAHTVVATSPANDDRPPDQAHRVYRATTVTVTAHGRDGWQGTPEQYTVFCQLVFRDNRWAVGGYTVT